jgi:hypothetical protein
MIRSLSRPYDRSHSRRYATKEPKHPTGDQPANRKAYDKDFGQNPWSDPANRAHDRPGHHADNPQWCHIPATNKKQLEDGSNGQCVD